MADKGQRSGFTLIEMMVVVAIIIALMGIVVRLSSVGNYDKARMYTVQRQQRLENALSGYNAAYGSYPPVRLHSSRDIYAAFDQSSGQDVTKHNENIWNWDIKYAGKGSVQSTSGDEKAEMDAWKQVQQACRAQPLAFSCPPNVNLQLLQQSIMEVQQERAASHDEMWSDYWSNPEIYKRIMAGFDDGISKNINRFDQSRDSVEWSELRLFKFGVMSFLLPRIPIALAGEFKCFQGDGPNIFDWPQWSYNNKMPADPLTGRRHWTWEEVNNMVRQGFDRTNPNARYRAIIYAIPSVAMTARWISNLERICTCDDDLHPYFGVNLRASMDGPGGNSNYFYDNVGMYMDPDVIHLPKGHESQLNLQFGGNITTVKDGWDEEFYYYSPAPYQGYVLWSSGANHRTFPPWVTRSSLEKKANERIAVWVEDDIVSMSK